MFAMQSKRPPAAARKENGTAVLGLGAYVTKNKLA